MAGQTRKKYKKFLKNFCGGKAENKSRAFPLRGERGCGIVFLLF